MKNAWLTTDEVAELFGVHSRTVLAWARVGWLPSRRIGRERYYARGVVLALRESWTAKVGAP